MSEKPKRKIYIRNVGRYHDPKYWWLRRKTNISTSPVYFGFMRQYHTNQPNDEPYGINSIKNKHSKFKRKKHTNEPNFVEVHMYLRRYHRELVVERGRRYIRIVGGYDRAKMCGSALQYLFVWTRLG